MPYDDSNIKKMVREQLEKKVSFSRAKKVSKECQDLIHKILEVNSKKRLTVSSILGHVWLKEPEVQVQPSLSAKNIQRQENMLEASDALKAELGGASAQRAPTASWILLI